MTDESKQVGTVDREKLGAIIEHMDPTSHIGVQMGIWLALLDINQTLRQVYELDQPEHQPEPQIPTISLLKEGEVGKAYLVRFRDIEHNPARVIVTAHNMTAIQQHFRTRLPDCKILEIDDGE